MTKIDAAAGAQRSRASTRKIALIAASAAAILGLAVPVGGLTISTPAAAKATPAKSTRHKPNIIIILADDLGHNDLSLSGNSLSQTPNIDRLAHEGARFMTAYSGDAICSPSRAALLTGRNPQRFGFEFNISEAGFAKRVQDYTPDSEVSKKQQVMQGAPPPPPDLNGLAPDEITIAQALKGNGYHTGIIGKWHLGRARSLNPVNRGFDEFFGLLGGAALHAPPDDPNIVSARLAWNGNDANLWKHATNNVVRGLGEPFPAGGYLSDVFADEAVRFIETNKARPFFLYLAFNAPHLPLQAPRAFYDKLSYIKDEKTRVYYAMIAATDAAIGRILDSLKTQGLDENTVVIFTSDNGGTPFSRIPEMNLPFRGSKITYFEGGLNVPMLVRWPGHISQGMIVPGVASQLDLFPTIAAVSDTPMPRGRAYDGENILSVLMPGADAPAIDLGNRTLVWRKGGYRVIRMGKYKLQLSDEPARTWLFDLDRDPTERINIAASMPAKIGELTAALLAREKQYPAPAWAAQAKLRVDVDGVPEDTSIERDYIMWAN